MVKSTTILREKARDRNSEQSRLHAAYGPGMGYGNCYAANKSALSAL